MWDAAGALLGCGWAAAPWARILLGRDAARKGALAWCGRGAVRAFGPPGCARATAARSSGRSGAATLLSAAVAS